MTSSSESKEIPNEGEYVEILTWKRRKYEINPKDRKWRAPQVCEKVFNSLGRRKNKPIRNSVTTSNRNSVTRQLPAEMRKKRDRSDLLIYGVAIVECVFLGMAVLMAITSGPLIKTTMRAESARNQLLDQLPPTIVIIKAENGTETAMKPEEIAKVSVIATSIYSLLQFTAILILFTGLFTRNHRFLLVFFAWCLISNIIILGSLIFGIVKISQTRQEPLAPPPRLGFKIPPIGNLLDPLFQGDGGGPAAILGSLFGTDSNGKPNFPIDLSGLGLPEFGANSRGDVSSTGETEEGSEDVGDFLSRIISPFLETSKQQAASTGEKEDENPLLNLFNALSGDQDSGSGRRKKRSDPVLPPGAPPIPPTPALPLLPPDAHGASHSETSSGNGLPAAISSFLPKEGTVIPLPGIELPPVIQDFIYDSLDDAFYFLIGFTIAKALASIYSLVACLMCSVEFRHRSRSIATGDMEMKNGFGTKYP